MTAGFALAVYMMSAINERFAAMREIASGRIDRIERELEGPIE